MDFERGKLYVIRATREGARLSWMLACTPNTNVRAAQADFMEWAYPLHDHTFEVAVDTIEPLKSEVETSTLSYCELVGRLAEEVLVGLHWSAWVMEGLRSWSDVLFEWEGLEEGETKELVANFEWYPEDDLLSVHVALSGSGLYDRHAVPILTTDEELERAMQAGSLVHMLDGLIQPYNLGKILNLEGGDGTCFG